MIATLNPPKKSLFGARKSSDVLKINRVEISDPVDSFLAAKRHNAKENLTVTLHAKQRYIQRFLYPEKFDHLDRCSKEKCPVCDKMNRQIQDEIRIRQNSLNEEILQIAKNAPEILMLDRDIRTFIKQKYNQNLPLRLMYTSRIIFVIQDDISNNSSAIVTLIPMKSRLGYEIKRQLNVQQVG